MDLSKYPIDKLFYFAAGIIPGFVALWIFEMAHPGFISWFFSLPFLGYKTRLSAALLACFVVGNTITNFLTGFLGAVGAIIGQIKAKAPWQPSTAFEVAPWRDRIWRTALKNYLEADAPNDTFLMKAEVYEYRKKLIESYPNPGNAAQALADLNMEKLHTEIDDGKWREWYDHFHGLVVWKGGIQDFMFHVQVGLRFNLEAAGLCALVGAIFVPGVRHWWSLVPAAGWVLMLIAEAYTAVANALNQWATLRLQIEYLRHLKKA